MRNVEFTRITREIDRNVKAIGALLGDEKRHLVDREVLGEAATQSIFEKTFDDGKHRLADSEMTAEAAQGAVRRAVCRFGLVEGASWVLRSCPRPVWRQAVAELALYEALLDRARALPGLEREDVATLADTVERHLKTLGHSVLMVEAGSKSRPEAPRVAREYLELKRHAKQAARIVDDEAPGVVDDVTGAVESTAGSWTKRHAEAPRRETGPKAMHDANGDHVPRGIIGRLYGSEWRGR